MFRHHFHFNFFPNYIYCTSTFTCTLRDLRLNWHCHNISLGYHSIGKVNMFIKYTDHTCSASCSWPLYILLHLSPETRNRKFLSFLGVFCPSTLHSLWLFFWILSLKTSFAGYFRFISLIYNIYSLCLTYPSLN
jgi:hypothetical protein